MTDESSRPDEVIGNWRYTTAELAALSHLKADEGDPMELWKILRSRAEALEVEPLPETHRVRIFRGLCRLSDPSAVALVENRQVSADSAAEIGHAGKIYRLRMGFSLVSIRVW
jgi:hypothetical protein